MNMDLSELFGDHQQGSRYVWGFRMDPEQEQYLRTITANINEVQPLKYVFDEERFPFVRIYEAVLPDGSIKQAESFFDQLEMGSKKFKLEWGQIEETGEHIILYTQVSEFLKQFQLSVMMKISPLRQGRWDGEYQLNKLNQVEKDSVLRWGWPRGEDLHPFVLVGHGHDKLSISKINLDWPFKDMKVRTAFMGKEIEPGRYVVLDEKELLDGE